MSGYAVRYSAEALDDLRSIYSYIALTLKEPVTAQKQVDRIRKEIRSLNTLPMRYAVVDWQPWQGMGMRSVSVDNFVIFYLVDFDAELVSIVRIFYGGRDIRNLVQSK